MGVRRSDGMGRGGLARRGWRRWPLPSLERHGTSRGSAGRGGPGGGSRRTRHPRKVAFGHPESAFLARLAARAPAAAGRRLLPVQRLIPPAPPSPLQPPAALGVSGRAVTAPRGCSGATAKLDTFPAPGVCR